MDAERAVDQPIRFYAIGHSDVEGYWETFMLATTPENALNRYKRWIKSYKILTSPFTSKYKVDVMEAVINDFGVLESTVTLLYDQEIC